MRELPGRKQLVFPFRPKTGWAVRRDGDWVRSGKKALTETSASSQGLPGKWLAGIQRSGTDATYRSFGLKG